MVAMTYTQTDYLIGTLPNGKKIALTTITVTGAGFDANTTIRCKLLKNIEYFFVGYPDANTVPTSFCAITKTAAVPNCLTTTPTATIQANVIKILAFGT